MEESDFASPPIQEYGMGWLIVDSSDLVVPFVLLQSAGYSLYRLLSGSLDRDELAWLPRATIEAATKGE